MQMYLGYPQWAHPQQYLVMGSAPWVGPVVPMATVQENREVYQGASGEFPCSEGGSPITSPSRTSSDCMSPNLPLSSPQNGDVALPCSTLFVANLEPHQTEEELVLLFKQCEGFVKAKIYTKGGPPVCFVEFKDDSAAAAAMKTLQNFVMLSSKRGTGIRIEYARQRMGTPRKTSTSSSRSTTSLSNDSSLLGLS